MNVWKIGSFFILIGAVIVIACTTPVYQYSIQRWPADPYRAVVLYRGALTDADTALLRTIESTVTSFQPPANLVIQTVNVDEQLPRELAGLSGIASTGVLPLVVLQYPREIQNGRSVWNGPLTSNAVQSLVLSPARERVAAGLLQGCSGMWLFVESGDRQKDTAALKQFESMQLAPVIISRTDPRETITLAMLMHSEPDLFDYKNEPMAFPVYGRGRVLYSLVGRGIIADNINAARRFLEGPCACEIKIQNPGTDLLIGANWEEAFRLFPEIDDDPVPPLSGVFVGAESTGTLQATSISATPAGLPEPLPVPAPWIPLSSILFGTGAVLTIFIITASAVVIIRSRGNR